MYDKFEESLASYNTYRLSKRLRKKYQDEEEFNILMDGLKKQDARHLQSIRRVVTEYAQPCYLAIVHTSAYTDKP
jgi:hypothetical protein